MHFRRRTIGRKGSRKLHLKTKAKTSSSAGHVAVQIPSLGNKLTVLDPAGKYFTKDSGGNVTSKDTTLEINSWLSYWKPVMGSDVHVTMVFSDTFDKTFTSTNDYLSWMTNRIK
ncbi:hypothetical protein MUO79_03485 [Candidatus Bathyarchaeota archaeon]|nr:hypothetical protein [Candidatus Bathyarchaeota archaeon]